MSFTQKFAKQVQASKQQNIYLIKGEDKGLECWHYVHIDQVKLPLLQRLMDQVPCEIDVSRYGSVLRSGWGPEPPQEVKNAVESGKPLEPEAPQDHYEVFYITPTDNQGKPFFAFVAVPHPLVEKFRYVSTKQDSQFVIVDYGEVLHWGWGEATAEDVRNVELAYDLKLGLSDRIPASA
jgi:hypothetical protein